MKYITSHKLSEKWNISQRRIVCLASEGKIDGAKLYGKSWMFPEDAIKPKDGRTKSGKFEQQEKDNFRYPLFEFRDISSFNPPLTKEEIIIKNCTEAFSALRFDDAQTILGDLPETAQNRYIRITALYCGCMVSMLLCDSVRFMDYYVKLKTELMEDFPHKLEMSEYLHEIDSILGENEYYANEFHKIPAYCYHISFQPRLCNLSAIWLALGDKQITSTDLSAHETNCAFLEKTDYVFDLQALHVYLACAYSILNKNEECYYHFYKALKLAEKYEMYSTIATMRYYYTEKSLDDALESFPAEFKKRIKQCNKNFHNIYMKFSNSLRMNDLYKFLTKNDYIYIVFAVQGLSNKEVAARLHVSIGTVGRRYGEIYAGFGVKNKAEMIALYHSLTNKNNNIDLNLDL